MSVQAALDFYERLARDEAYLAAIIAAGDREERLELAHREGYYFDQAELEEATAQFLEHSHIGRTQYDESTEERIAHTGLSLLDVVMVRVTGEYGDVSFFEDSGPLRLSPPTSPSSSSGE